MSCVLRIRSTKACSLVYKRASYCRGISEEVTEDGNKIKRVTEKGRSVGIDEEERKAKFGGSYYAITHSKQSQQVIIEMLKKHYSGIKP